MIPPKEQWCIQIDVTSVCNRACSNCTRLIGHAPTFFMSVPQFRNAIEVVKDFPNRSPPSKSSHLKLIGIIGGEPLLHPGFSNLVSTLAENVSKEHRGLWTGLNWQKSKHARIIRESFTVDGIHNNLHDLQESQHSPVLVASRDVIADAGIRDTAINNCWLQQRWCSTITPKGFFFCEVAGAFDWVFHGPGGLPVKSGCWQRPLEDFQDQIDRWCQQCGICLNLQGRNARIEVDDISQSNLKELQRLNSRRIRAGRYVAWDSERHSVVGEPWVYRR